MSKLCEFHAYILLWRKSQTFNIMALIMSMFDITVLET